MRAFIISAAIITAISSAAHADQFQFNAPTLDRWMYPFNGTPGTRTAAPTFAAFGQTDFDERDGQFLIAFDTASAGVTPGLAPSLYDVGGLTLRLTVFGGDFVYDPTQDAASSYGPDATTVDADTGRPVELYGAGFRNSYTAVSSMGPGGFSPPFFEENESFAPFPGKGVRSVFPVDELDGADVSNNLDSLNAGAGLFEVDPFAVGQTSLAAGASVPAGTEMTFAPDLTDPEVVTYLQQGLSDGWLVFVVTSLHPATFGGPATYPIFSTQDAASGAPELDLDVTLVPEPSAVALLGLGAIVVMRRRRRV